MLNEEAKKKIELIKKTAELKWSEQNLFVKLEVKDVPFTEFQLEFVLFGKIKWAIYFDRGAVNFGIWNNNKYDLLDNFTNVKVMRGFKVLTDEGLEHNYNILENVAKELIEKINKNK